MPPSYALATSTYSTAPRSRSMLKPVKCASVSFAPVARNTRRPAGGVEHHATSLGRPAGDEPGAQAAFGRDFAGVDFRFHKIAQLGFVDVQIAAQEGDDVFVREVFLVDDGLAGRGRGNAQESAQVFDGLDAGRGDLFALGGLGGRAVRDAGRGLHVGAVIAIVAEHDGVLAHGREQHVFVRNFAAHHAAVRSHGHDFRQARAGEDAVVRLARCRNTGRDLPARCGRNTRPSW